MNLTKQDVKERKRYERNRDCRWLQIEESKLQQRLSDIAIEHSTKLRMLSVEEGKFKAAAQRKGYASRSLTSLNHLSRRNSTEGMSKQSPSTSDSNDSRRGSQGDDNGKDNIKKYSSLEVPSIRVDLANNDGFLAMSASASPLTSRQSSPRPDTPLDAQSNTNSSSGTEQANNTNGGQLQQPQGQTRERSNTFGGQTTRYKPNLPEVQE